MTAYFQNPVTPNPVAAEGNTGSYQTFNGRDGSGAIYWSQSTKARIIYGDLLEYFTNIGMEKKIGYPSTDPQSGNGSSQGCPAGTTVYQTFSLAAKPVPNVVTPRTMYTLCSNGRGKVSRGQITLSGATTPRVTDVTRSSGSDAREDDGRYDDEEDDEDWSSSSDEDEADVAPPRSSGSSNSGNTPSSGPRTTGVDRSGSSSTTRSSSGVLTPRR